jgi:hypothetical protein
VADHDQTSTEPHGTSHAQQAPGGATSRGPEFGTGGEPQVPVPPYDELRGESGENSAAAAYDASNAPVPGPKTPLSDQERDGVSGTEMNPEPALGVGKSSGGRAEDLAPDRPDVGTKGPAQRPVGTADGEESDSAGGPGG